MRNYWKLTKILPFMLATSIILLGASYFYMTIVERDIPLPENIGNKEQNIKRVEGEGRGKEAFSFVVMGDSRHGHQIFEDLVRKAQSLHPAFIIHLGDFVHRAKPGYYDFFIAELLEMKINTPIFFTMGNHDLFMNKRGDINRKLFEKYFGPSEFAFEYGNSAFIFLDNGDLNNFGDYQLLWLKSVLEKYKDKEHKFICMHQPPMKLNLSYTDQPPDCGLGADGQDEKFLELIGHYNVDYVLASHYHGYFREENNGTDYVVTGGAGARLRQENSNFHFVYFIVKDKKVDERIFSTSKTWSPEDKYEHFLYTEVFDIIDNYPAFFFAVLTLSACYAIFSIFCLLIARHRR